MATGPGTALAALSAALQARLPETLDLRPAPWPVGAGAAGIGDDVHRAQLADDWADSGMRAKQLTRLIEVQVVAHNRQLAADHPLARDFAIVQDKRVVGRVLLGLNDAPVGGLATSGGEGPAVTLVEVAVHPHHQQQGIGSAVLEALLGAAGERSSPVRARAVFGTAALTWLIRAGFVETGGDALIHGLEWQPTVHR